MLNLNEKKEEKKQEKNRVKIIYFLLLGLFIITLSLYIYQKVFVPEEVKTSNENNNSSIIVDEQTEDESKETSVVNTKDDNEVDVENIKTVIKEFIPKFYTYDGNNHGAYLEASKPYLTNDFYKELVITDDADTTVPVYFYRNVTDISFKDYEVNDSIYSFVVDVKADLLDEQKTKLSTVRVEFNIDLVKEKNEWKISYFTLIGKSLTENETTN